MSASLVSPSPTSCATFRHGTEHWRLLAFGEAEPTAAAWVALMEAVRAPSAVPERRVVRVIVRLGRSWDVYAVEIAVEKML